MSILVLHPKEIEILWSDYETEKPTKSRIHGVPCLFSLSLMLLSAGLPRGLLPQTFHWTCGGGRNDHGQRCGGARDTTSGEWRGILAWRSTPACSFYPSRFHLPIPSPFSRFFSVVPSTWYVGFRSGFGPSRPVVILYAGFSVGIYLAALRQGGRVPVNQDFFLLSTSRLFHLNPPPPPTPPTKKQKKRRHTLPSTLTPPSHNSRIKTEISWSRGIRSLAVRFDVDDPEDSDGYYFPGKKTETHGLTST